MVSIEATALAELSDHSIGVWWFVSGQRSGSVTRYQMLATCMEGEHQIWFANERAGLAWPVARPWVEGNLLRDLGFEEHIVRDPRYSPFWRQWVRAMFVPRAIDHSPQCPAARRRWAPRDEFQEGAAMSSISTVGTFEYGGEVYAVEWHPDEIRVTDGAGMDAALIPFKNGRVLGEAAPGGPAAPAELLDALRECAARVLEAAAADGRGPWVDLNQPVPPRSAARQEPWGTGAPR